MCAEQGPLGDVERAKSYVMDRNLGIGASNKLMVTPSKKKESVVP